MNQHDIENIELPDIDDDKLPKCSFCLGRQFNKVSVIGKCGHVYHNECIRTLINGNSIECPQDRLPIDKEGVIKIYGHDLNLMMQEVSNTLISYKSKFTKIKQNEESLKNDNKNLNRKLDIKRKRQEVATKEKKRNESDLKEWKDKFDSILEEKGLSMKKIQALELEMEEEKNKKLGEGEQVEEILREKGKIIAQFEDKVAKLTEKININEKYRELKSFPAISTIITKVHKEIQNIVKEEHDKFLALDKEKCDSVGPFTELEKMIIYQGQVIKTSDGINIKNGWGRAQFCNASYFEGTWVNDDREGFGVEIKPSGSYKIGNWVNGKLNGYAKYVARNGCAYEGSWNDGKKEGKGAEIYIDSTGKHTYKGDFKNDKKNGKGIYICSSYTYEGEFKNGHVNGLGEMIWISGKKLYNGNWQNGKRHGKGTYIKKGEFQMTAEYDENKANGYGEVKFEGGFEYLGQLKDGKQNGWGRAKYPDGRTLEGLWKEGKMVKQMINPNGNNIPK